MRAPTVPVAEAPATPSPAAIEALLDAYGLMACVQAMADTYDANRTIAKWVHSTSRGHEAIQLVAGGLLLPQDYASPYYRDEAMLLAMGFTPYELMLQLLARRDDPFSGGRTYYGHPSMRREGMPTIPHQSSATGMQAIPATGMAHAIAYLESQKLLPSDEGEAPIVLCSLGDGSVTEGEVAEAFQMAILKKLPIVYLIQDNEWGISATSREMRAMDAYQYAAGFPGLTPHRVDGTDLEACLDLVGQVYANCRQHRGPHLIHATVPLLGHHTSGVRREWYRPEDDLKTHGTRDPFPRLHARLLELGVDDAELQAVRRRATERVAADWADAVAAPMPDPATVADHEFAPTTATQEMGVRHPEGGEKVVMVDAALHACDEILRSTPEALFYGQDVGGELGGVFREAALLAKRYGDERVFNTPIQEAYIVGSTAGMAAVGAKPIVEIQFADYIWSGMNQLVVELSKSCYLSMGKFPVGCVIRIPCGAYGGGGPYHSGCIESAVLSIRGIKIAYPSNAADMKGLMKAAFIDPNPVIMFEHKGLYWSKVPGTDEAKTIEPDEHYIVPLGKARVYQQATNEAVDNGESCLVVTYGMGVHWARNASKQGSLQGRVEILDLRTLYPCDEDAVDEAVRRHGRVLVLTEEPLLNSFAEALAGRIAQRCFRNLDAPVQAMGALPLPAIAMNDALEAAMLPTMDKVQKRIEVLLAY